jgi:hypothetical protein
LQFTSDSTGALLDSFTLYRSWDVTPLPPSAPAFDSRAFQAAMIAVVVLLVLGCGVAPLCACYRARLPVGPGSWAGGLGTGTGLARYEKASDGGIHTSDIELM